MATVQLEKRPEPVEEGYKRVEDVRFLKGRGNFLDDMHPENVAYMGIVRSPYSHAIVKGVDFSRARESEDFIDGISGEDLRGIIQPVSGNPRQKQAPRYHLATGKTRFTGEAVAAFVAKSRYAVEDLIELVHVEYEALPSILTIEEAKNGKAKVYDEWEDNVVFRHEIKKGDASRAISESKYVVNARLGIKRQHGAPIEPRSVVASYDPDEDIYHVFGTVQGAHRLQNYLSNEMKLPANKFHVVVRDVGGAFGAKGANSYPEPLLACILSKKTGLTIKWTSTRTEDMLESAPGRDQYCDIQLASNELGRITALKTMIEADVGVSGTLSLSVMLTMSLLPGAYNIPNLDLVGVAYATNKAPIGPVRGAGRPEAIFFIERAVDMMSEKLSVDPIEFRMKNLVQPDEMPFANGAGSVYDSGNFQLLVRRLIKESDYKSLLDWRDQINRSGLDEMVAGVGMCVEVEDTGSLLKETAKVAVGVDGKITVWTGSSPHGQGLETTLAQLASKELNVRIDQVNVLWGDTFNLPTSIGTFGSRSMATGGSAVVDACRKLKAEIANRVSKIHPTRPDEISLENGQVFSVDRDLDGKVSKREKILSLSSLIEQTGPIESFTEYTAKGVPFASGAHLCALTVDRKSGLVHLQKYVAIADSGIVVNPVIVDGQLHGGIVHGIGGTLLEQVLYSNDGQLLTSNFLDYTIPTALEIPRQMVIAHVETPSTMTLNGAKGVGESGTIAAYPAIFNALNDALRATGSRNRINYAPAFPETIASAFTDK